MLVEYGDESSMAMILQLSERELLTELIKDQQKVHEYIFSILLHVTVVRKKRRLEFLILLYLQLSSLSRPLFGFLQTFCAVCDNRGGIIDMCLEYVSIRIRR